MYIHVLLEEVCPPAMLVLFGRRVGSNGGKICSRREEEEGRS
jgi:hypothetical protein